MNIQNIITLIKSLTLINIHGIISYKLKQGVIKMLSVVKGYKIRQNADNEIFVTEGRLIVSLSKALTERVESIFEGSKRKKNWEIMEEIMIQYINSENLQGLFEEKVIEDLLKGIFGEAEYLDEFFSFKKMFYKHLELEVVGFYTRL